MSEVTIEEINEVENYASRESIWNQYDGFEIKLSDGNILFLGISNFQDCCEDWGYMVLQDDDPDYFVGSEYRGVTFVKVSGENIKIGEKTYNFDEGGIAFIEIHTNRGVLKLAVYNAHNGYYGHQVVFYRNDTEIKSTGL